MQDLPTGLALCIVPFILGWLAASSYYKVSSLRAKVAQLETDNGELNGKVAKLNDDNTGLRVKLTQADAEMDSKNARLSKLQNDLMLAESERNIFKSKLADCEGGKKSAKPASIEFLGKKWKTDDLKIVEGIGPKIADLLHADGIKTWAQLAAASTDRLKGILDAAGPNYAMHDPGTWPEQARLADDGQWDALKRLQEQLDAGRSA